MSACVSVSNSLVCMPMCDTTAASVGMEGKTSPSRSPTGVDVDVDSDAQAQAHGPAEAGAAPAMDAFGGTTVAADDGGADIAAAGGGGGGGGGAGRGAGRGVSSSGTAPDPTTLLPAIPKFVAPSSYLRPKISSQRSAMASTSTESKPLSPLDKEQLQGLVSRLTRSRTQLHQPGHPWWCFNAGLSLRRLWWHRIPVLTLLSTERNPRFPQGPHQLRCPTALLPPDCSRYGPAHQEEPQHSNSKRCVTPRLVPPPTGIA